MTTTIQFPGQQTDTHTASLAPIRPQGALLQRAGQFLTPPPIIRTGLLIASCVVAFYAVEALAPHDFKPSTHVGSYEMELHKATKTGELKAQIVYDAKLRSIDAQLQAYVKSVEQSVQQSNDQYRSTAETVAKLYQSTFERANIFAQATANLQTQYAMFRAQLAQNSYSTEMAGVKLATLGKFFFALSGDQESAQTAGEIATQLRGQVLSEVDKAMQEGVRISPKGWDTGLADVQQIKAAFRDVEPAKLPEPPRFASE